MPVSADQAAALATALGAARGLRPGQLPTPEVFAEALTGIEECAALVAGAAPLAPAPRFGPPAPADVPSP